jgi:hypothetical protein
MEKCLEKREWRRILTLGDSIGKRHHLGLVSALTDQGYNCSLLKEAAKTPTPDVNYFASDIPLNVSLRGCYTCPARLVECRQGSSVLLVEHLALGRLTDTSIQSPNLFNTSLDFYFKHHLADSPPDVIIIGPPFIHEVNEPSGKRDPIAVVIQRLRNLISQLASLVTPSADVIWIPQATTWQGDGRNQDVAELNSALFDILASRFLDPNDTWWGFYDEQSLTCGLREICYDSVHLTHEYYVIMMQHLFALFCNVNLSV